MGELVDLALSRALVLDMAVAADLLFDGDDVADWPGVLSGLLQGQQSDVVVDTALGLTARLFAEFEHSVADAAEGGSDETSGLDQSLGRIVMSRDIAQVVVETIWGWQGQGQIVTECQDLLEMVALDEVVGLGGLAGGVVHGPSRLALLRESCSKKALLDLVVLALGISTLCAVLLDDEHEQPGDPMRRLLGAEMTPQEYGGVT